MGLNTTHNCFNGCYSSFGTFRRLLAEQIGIRLFDYEGYGKGGTKKLNTITHDIFPLLNHSDCDGILTVEEAKRIVNGLNNILDNYKPISDNKFDDDGFKNKIIQFRDGCLEAINKNEVIEFD